MRRLICVFVDRIWQKQVFSWCGLFKLLILYKIHVSVYFYCSYLLTTCKHQISEFGNQGQVGIDWDWFLAAWTGSILLEVHEVFREKNVQLKQNWMKLFCEKLTLIFFPNGDFSVITFLFTGTKDHYHLLPISVCWRVLPVTFSCMQVARSDARQPGMRMVEGSILGSGNILSWRLVVKSFP